MHTPCGCLVGRGRFQTCPYVVVWVMATDPPSARGIPRFGDGPLGFAGSRPFTLREGGKATRRVAPTVGAALPVRRWCWTRLGGLRL